LHANRARALVSELFRLDELGYNASDGDEVPAGKEEKARMAAASCPEGAISLEGE
jgi:ferredoxin